MHLIDRHRKPPPQILHGAGFTLDIETAERHFTYRMTRRVQKVTSAGVVRSRVMVVGYEVTVAGRVFRTDEDQNRAEINPGDDMGEWAWVMAAMLYRHGMRKLPPSQRHTLRRPEDLVKIQDERTGRWVMAQEWGR